MYKRREKNLIKTQLSLTGGVIATQLLDVAIRVQAVRAFAVSEMTSLLESFPTTCQNDSMYEVLYAAAWIVGEFSRYNNLSNLIVFYRTFSQIYFLKKTIFPECSRKSYENLQKIRKKIV